MNGLAPRDAATSAPRAVLLAGRVGSPGVVLERAGDRSDRSLEQGGLGVLDPDGGLGCGWSRADRKSDQCRDDGGGGTKAMVRQRSPPSSRGSGMRLAAGRSSGLDAAPGSPGLPAGLPGRGGQWLPLGAPVGRPHSGGTAPDSHRFPLTVRGVGNCTTADAGASVSVLLVTMSPGAAGRLASRAVRSGCRTWAIGRTTDSRRSHGQSRAARPSGRPSPRTARTLGRRCRHRRGARRRRRS